MTLCDCLIVCLTPTLPHCLSDCLLALTCVGTVSLPASPCASQAPRCLTFSDELDLAAMSLNKNVSVVLTDHNELSQAPPPPLPSHRHHHPPHHQLWLSHCLGRVMNVLPSDARPPSLFRWLTARFTLFTIVLFFAPLCYNQLSRQWRHISLVA